MEQGLAPGTNVKFPPLYSPIPSPRLPKLRGDRDEHGHKHNNSDIPFSGASSPIYDGEPSSANSRASLVSRNLLEHEYNLVTLHGPLNHSYIVQMPRDQIFRVPPPENADIVKRSRQLLPKRKRPRNFKACLPCLYAFAILFIVLVLALIVLQLFLEHENPELIVEKLAFKNSTRPEYDISLIAKNPNQNLFTISYGGAEDAELIYKRKSLAEGAFPVLEQGPKDETNVRISFTSLKKNSLPADLVKNLKGKKMKAPLEFSLVMEMPIRSKVLIMPAFTSEKMSIKCEFKVDNLASRTKILAQKCTTNVR